MAPPAARPPNMPSPNWKPHFNPQPEVDPPVILVSDYEQDPPVTMRYVNGDNELEFATVFRNVSALSGHPGRGMLSCEDETAAEPVFQFKECEGEYLDAFWNCASNLCDYFADFLTSDTVVMQSVWFELLDMLQDATILPHQFWISGVPACNHAKDFILYTTYFRKLTKDLIAPRDVSISDPLMTPMNLVGGLFPGKSGLKSWQQFLYKDSPGFNVPKSKRVYLNAAPNTTDHTAFDMHIPRGGLALLDSHTKRLRELTKKVYKNDPNTLTEKLAEFDSKTLDLNHVSTYTAIDGRQILTKPMHPDLESVQTSARDFELLDPGFQNPFPSLDLVNESIGFYKGKELYSHPDEGDGKYQMLSVGSPEALQDPNAQAKVDRAAYSDMFDSWTSKA